jgi:hypothetical protein
VTAWARENFTSRGMVADIAIHDVEASDGGRNLHAHVMLTDRPLDANTATGFATKKDRSWNGVDLVEQARESWADHANRALEREGREIRLDHRSLVAQRADALARGDDDQARKLDREPEPKLGPTAHAMEQRGEKTERGDLRRHVQRVNEWVQEHARPALDRANERIDQLREHIREVPKWARDFAEKRGWRQPDEARDQERNEAMHKAMREQREERHPPHERWAHREAERRDQEAATKSRSEILRDYFADQKRDEALRGAMRDQVAERQQDRAREAAQQRTRPQSRGRDRGMER